MRAVRRSGTAPELALRQHLRDAGVVCQRSRASLPGSPDLVFREEKLAVFVDGCFWHGCKEHRTIPRSNARFWADKIKRNRARDRRVDRDLRALGWTTLRIWEHAVDRLPRRCVARVERALARCLSVRLGQLLGLSTPGQD
ncbi:MAG: very short patch repair endonuclease [Gemmatimonadaceae bacterium]